MADQSVRIDNLPDSGSPARVAFDMTKYMIKLLPASPNNEHRISAILDLYAECYSAATGRRLSKK